MNKIYFFTLFFFVFLSYGSNFPSFLSSMILGDTSDFPNLSFFRNFTFTNNNYSTIQSYVYVSEPEYYITGDNCGNLSYWNLSSGSILFQYQLPLGYLNSSNLSLICSQPNRSISNIIFLENDRKIAFSAGNNLYLADLPSKITLLLLNFHQNQIVSLTFLRKRNWFVSADITGNIAFWDVDGSYLKKNYVFFSINNVQSEYDSNFLFVTGSTSSYLVIINIESNHIMKTIQLDGQIKNIIDLKFTDYVACLYSNNSVVIINKHNWKTDKVLPYTQNVNSLSFDYNNNLLVVCQDKGASWLNIADYSSTVAVSRGDGEGRMIGSDIFSKPDNDYLVTVFQSYAVVYSFETHHIPHNRNSSYVINETLIWNISYSNITNLLHYHDDKSKNELLIFSDDNGTIQICNITNGEHFIIYNDEYDRAITSLIQINNNTLIAFGIGKDIIVWDVEINALHRNLSGHTNNVTCLHYIPEIERLVSGSLDGFVIQWDINSCLNNSVYIYTSGIKTIDYIERSNILIVVGINDEYIQTWNLTSRSLISRFNANQEIVLEIVNIPDTPYFLSAGSDNSLVLRNNYEPNMQLLLILSGNDLKFLDIESKNLSSLSSENLMASQGLLFYPYILEGPFDNNDNVSYSILIDATANYVQAYNLTIYWQHDASENQTNHSSFLNLINEVSKSDSEIIILNYAYSSSLKYLVTGDSNGNLKIWNATEGKLLKTYKTNSDNTISLQILSPDNLIAYTQKNSINILDLGSLSTPFSLSDHSDDVTSLSYNCDSKLLISGSLDGTIKVWNVTNRTVLTTIYAFGSGVSHVLSDTINNVIMCTGFNFTEIRVFKLTGEQINSFPHLVNTVSQMISLGSFGIAYFGVEQLVFIRSSDTGYIERLKFDTLPNDMTYDQYHNTLIISTNNQVFIYNLNNKNNNIESVINESLAFTYIASSYEVVEDASSRYNTILIEETEQSLKFWNMTYNDTKAANGSNYYLDYLNSIIMDISPDMLLYINQNEILVVGSHDGYLTYYDTSNGKVLNKTKTPTDSLSNLILSSEDSSLIAVASYNYIYVYYTKNYSLHSVINCNLATISALDWDFDRNYLLFGDKNGYISTWSVVTSNCSFDSFKAHDLGVSSIKYLGKQQILTSGVDDNTVKEWNSINHDMIHSLYGPIDPPVVKNGRLLNAVGNSANIGYMPITNIIITTGFGAIFVWDKTNSTIIKSIYVNQTIISIQSVNDKNILVFTTPNMLYFLNLYDYNLSSITQAKSTFSSFQAYENKTDSNKYIALASNEGNLNVFHIVNFNGDQSHNHNNNTNSSEDSSKSWIAGVVIGVLAGIIIIGVLIACLVKRYRNKKIEEHGYKQFNDTQTENPKSKNETIEENKA